MPAACKCNMSSAPSARKRRARKLPCPAWHPAGTTGPPCRTCGDAMCSRPNRPGLLDFARASLAVAGLLCLGGSDALAHCFVGARFFPATLAIDDPCVADEISLPTVSIFKNGDDPSAKELDVSGEYSKRITEN